MTSIPAVDALRLFRLDGKVAVITGASSGVGARTARVLDALGASVVVAARRRDRLAELAGELRDGHPVVCDVSVRGASAGLVAETVERLGRVDIAVANAGMTNVVPALREPVDSFAEVINLDLIAPFELAQAAALVMKERGEGGAIINMGSSVAFRSAPTMPEASYAAAKTGLVGLTRDLALQWARYGIRVNALCPGLFPSEMTAELYESDTLRAGFLTTVPMRRLPEIHELDGAIAFLAGPASSYMTGQTLVVDGGGVL
jgi:NAD(P)-dependent dehydrogenase (short-subunit alcohol dehydrogenase family)